jgi:hypothetical protein
MLRWMVGDDGETIYTMNRKPWATNRKLRLLACGLYRLVGPANDSLRAVEEAERFADGLVEKLGPSEWIVHNRDASMAARLMLEYVRYNDFRFSIPERKQAGLIRDIFGNPFWTCSHVQYLPASWLTWHDGLIPLMAQKMHENCDFSDMPIMADALEEAGCTDEDILRHCRGEEPYFEYRAAGGGLPVVKVWRKSRGPHVRGCWVVDSLLGKE